MNRFFAASGVVAALTMLVGCEDGPNQTFTPSPANAGSLWNNGGAAGNSTGASQGYAGAGNTGANLNEICNAETKHTRWAAMVKMPILPPAIAGGMDEAGGPAGDGVPDPTGSFAKETWTGMTLDQGEAINCQSTFVEDVYGDGSVYYAAWGDNGEVNAEYYTSNRQVISFALVQGYLGTVEATSADGQHHFSIGIGTPPQMDKQPYLFDWHNANPAVFHGQVTTMFNALAATFSSFGQETDCIASGHCIAGDFGDQGAYIWFVPLGMTIDMQSTNATQPVPSTPIEIDQDKTKVLGYSNAAIWLKNDAAGEGPTATQNAVFNTTKNCQYVMGMPFSTFRDNCVAPTTDATKNATEMAKLFGSIAHDDETYGFDVVGVDPDFAATSLAPTAVINDSDRPGDNDTAYSLRVDQEALGVIRNDYTGDDPTQAKDYHGLGLLTLEWINSAQNFLKATYGPGSPYAVGGGVPITHNLGDAACVNVAGADMATTLHNAHLAGCTGLEGVVTTAPKTARGVANDPIALGPDAATRFSALQIGMKPSRWNSFFCYDESGNVLDNNQYSKCVGQNLDPDLHGATQYFFDTAYYALTQVMGDGLIGNLPTEVQDVRFFFKNWIYSLIRNLAVADQTTPPSLATIDAVSIDQNELFFDAIGSGQFEFAEYVDRHSVNATTPPLDVHITVDVLHGIINDYTFYRHMYRGESALYTAMGDPTGAANVVLLSSVFGSPVLKAAYPSLECATNINPTDQNCATSQTSPAASCTDGSTFCAPVDPVTGTYAKNDDGTLRLSPYQGAWGTTVFTVATFPPITVKTVFNNIESATVDTSVYTNPYGVVSGAKPSGVVEKLIPWFPKGADYGFPIAINGAQDSFIETYNIDYSGVSVSANMDYDMAIVPGSTVTALKIAAIETTDYLGEAFACYDPGTGDVLGARMYTSAATIMDWFTAHPGAASACAMIFQYSPYGNYLDHIVSQTYGVDLSINPGAGGGRVVDVLIFDPSYIGQ